MKSKIRRFSRRCAGSTEVEGIYLNVLSSASGGALECGVRTAGKWVFNNALASSTLPDKIYSRISKGRALVRFGVRATVDTHLVGAQLGLTSRPWYRRGDQDV